MVRIKWLAIVASFYIFGIITYNMESTVFNNFVGFLGGMLMGHIALKIAEMEDGDD